MNKNIIYRFYLLKNVNIQLRSHPSHLIALLFYKEVHELKKGAIAIIIKDYNQIYNREQTFFESMNAMKNFSRRFFFKKK